MVVTQVRLLSMVGIASVADRFSPVTVTSKIFQRGSQISKNPFFSVLSRRSRTTFPASSTAFTDRTVSLSSP
jgi:hypothetical protein